MQTKLKKEHFESELTLPEYPETQHCLISGNKIISRDVWETISPTLRCFYALKEITPVLN